MTRKRSDFQTTEPAVSAWNGELTYGELYRIKTGLAGRYVPFGVSYCSPVQSFNHGSWCWRLGNFPEQSHSFALKSCLTTLQGLLDREMMTSNISRLLDLGVRPPTIVPLCFEKSMWTTVAMLGVMKTGATFVLFDSSHPDDRLQVIYRQANVVESHEP